MKQFLKDHPLTYFASCMVLICIILYFVEGPPMRPPASSGEYVSEAETFAAEVQSLVADSSDARLVLGNPRLTLFVHGELTQWFLTVSSFSRARPLLEKQGWAFIDIDPHGLHIYGFLSAGEGAIQQVGELQLDGSFNQVEFTVEGEKHLFFLKSPLYVCTAQSGEIFYVLFDKDAVFRVLSHEQYGAFYFTDGGEPPTSE